MASEAAQLQSLGEETWGERVGRARTRAKVSLKEAAARVATVMGPVSYSTLMRLEWLQEVPDDDRRRLLAFAALLVYGFDPADFELDDESFPPYLNVSTLREALVGDGATSVAPYACTPASGESRDGEQRAA